MEQSIAKVLAFVFFILLGHMLRRWNVLRPEAFHAVSGLVVYLNNSPLKREGFLGTSTDFSFRSF